MKKDETKKATTIARLNARVVTPEELDQVSGGMMRAGTCCSCGSCTPCGPDDCPGED